MASTEPFYGPEVVQRPIGASVVVEQKAATAFIIGTAPIHLVHATAQDRAPYINKRIIVRRREEIAQFFGPQTEGYDLPNRLDALFLQAKEKGIGTLVVVNVFDPDVHKDGEDAPDPTQVANTDIIGTFDASGVASGLKLVYGCFQAFGWFPKQIDVGAWDALAGVRTEVEAINNRIRSRAGLNAPFGATRQEVIEARGPGGLWDWQLNSRRLQLHWPYMTFTSSETGDPVQVPYSTVHTGVWLSSIMEYGYHHSPSNRRIVVDDAAQDVLYIPGDKSDDIQLLRGAGIVTCEERWGKGPHTSGNRNAAHPTDTDYRSFMHVQFVEDMLHEAVIFFLDDWKDRNGNPASLEYIEERINGHLDGKSAGEDPVLYGGQFWFDRTLTTPDTIVAGQFFWQLDHMPVGLMERLTVQSGININLVRNPLGLASS